jgi:NAD(P)-dependent dehydrogenase (short-subunit alcohol dehydrogenase family)
MAMRLKDDVALITGGGSGIGRATCIRLAEEGAVVAVLDRDLEGARATVQEIESAGGRALAVKADVSRAEDVEAAVAEVVAALGRVDILVNNAGVSTVISVAKMTEEQWDQTIDVNLKGTFLCCRAVIPGMKERRRGKIVNVSSLFGLDGGPARAHYSASKSGVIGFTRSLATELGYFNINVNAVGPGIIETPMFLSDMGAELREALPERVPLRRLGQPRDLANAVLFLASEEGSYVTGQCLFVCGGLSASAGLA